MFVEFNEMPQDSRIWIYQSDRELDGSEVEIINTQTMEFLTKWTAHGADLKSSAKIFYNCFLVICLDEKMAAASGCSIDASVHFVQALGQNLNLDFFNRTQIAFLIDDKVKMDSLNNIKNGIMTEGINAQSLTFNNLIQQKSELDEKWLAPVENSWLGRYFKTQKA